MSFNLSGIIKDKLTADFISKAASFFGEDEHSVSKAVSGILPSVIGSIISKSNSGITGANDLLNISKEAYQSGVFKNTETLMENDLLNKGAVLLQYLLGDKSNTLIEVIAKFADIRSSTTSNLVSMAVPVALSEAGKHAIENNLGASGFVDMLHTQRNSIMGTMPAGLTSIMRMSGLDIIADNTSIVAGNASPKTSVPDYYENSEMTTAKGIKWLLPILVLIAIGLLAWWFLSGGREAYSSLKTDTIAVVNGTDTAILKEIGKIDTLTGDFIYDQGTLKTFELPGNGDVLEVGENSTEAKLLSFINDADQKIDTIKGNWFELTNVRFKTGSSVLTEESMVQLKNLAAIAKSYPLVQFKFGGYTDNTGDSIKNVTLSRKRAEVVASKVREFGAAASSVVDFAGYGPQWPIGDNNTAEGKAMNRRVAVNVKAK
jgi:OmpA-OmpF porin, OOP family